jgi:prepilin-type N-terminal cleavage/methylation domain-containing protein
MLPPHRPSSTARPAFTLVEMVVVIAIIVVLMIAGVQVLGGGEGPSRRTAADSITGLVEQARTTAITTRSTVILAVAEPGDLPVNDGRCRLGLFRVANWSEDGTTADAVLIRRWQTLPTGIALLGGEVDGVRNPLDESQTTLRYRAGSKTLEVPVHLIAFGPRGGLQLPQGSDPIALRIAAGTYRDGRAVSTSRAAERTAAETHLRIGRIVARPYRAN